MRERLPRLVIRAEAQIFSRKICVHEFARIHLVVGIPGRLELAKRGHQLRTEHFGQQRAARLTVAMFAGERTAVADDEVGGTLDECAVVANTVGALEVEADAHVNAAVAEVSVERAAIVVLVEQLADVAQIGAEFCRRNRCVVPTLPFGWDTGREGGSARPGFADLPDVLRFGRSIDASARSLRQASHGGDELLGSIVANCGIVGPELDQKKTMPFGKQVHVWRVLATEALN